MIRINKMVNLQVYLYYLSKMQLVMKVCLIQLLIISIFASLFLENMTDYNSFCKVSTYLEQSEKSDSAEKSKTKYEKEIIEDDWYHSMHTIHISLSSLFHIYLDFKSEYQSPFLAYIALPPKVF